MLALLLALLPLQAESDLTPLFDGQTLAGWVTRGERYDGAADWRVEDGCIVGSQGAKGEGGLLYTEKSYTSFELRLDVQLDTPFDSGVFLRMVPASENQKGAQVTLDWRADGEIGAIYADGFLQHNEAAKAKFRGDAWNDVRVRCTGFDMHLQVWLNGECITDFRHAPADPFEFAPRGKLGIQVHGERGDTGAARFRKLRLVELPIFADDFGADGAVRSDVRGWQALLAPGQSTLDGFSIAGDPRGYQLADGVLSILGNREGGHIFTNEDYQDFELRFDFRLAPMANSGLFLRAARDGSNPAFSGCEVQILDDFNWERVTGTKLKPWQFTGSLYGSVPPGDRSALRPLGEWNIYEVLYRGSRLAVALNGRTLYDVNTLALTPEQGEPFTKRAARGFIGIQSHGAEQPTPEPMVAFRRFFLRPL